MSRMAPALTHALRIDTLIGSVLALLGGLTTCGWLLQVRAMVELHHGLIPMVFNTGLCFLLSGIALALSSSRHAAAKSARSAIAVVLISLCGLTLAEIMLDTSLGIDLASLHEWFDYGNTKPGRMAPNTASGFILIGAAIFLSDRVRTTRSALAVVALTFSVLAVGLTGLVGYLLAPDLLFGWARSARMAVQTASGMILASMGLWLSWSRSAWYLSEEHLREDGKIRLLSAAILVIVTTTAGLTGFVLLQRSLETALEGRLEAIIQSRGPWFRAMTEQAGADARFSVDLSGLKAAARDLLTQSKGADLHKHAALAEPLLKRFRAIAIEDADQKRVAAFGSIDPQPAFTAALDPLGANQIVWSGQTILRTRVALEAEGKRVGSILIDQAMPDLDGPLFNMATLGRTAEVSACVLSESRLRCLPNSKNAAPFTVAVRGGASPLPMEIALQGKRGVVYTLDYKRNNVIAAYGELVPGLGFVAKQDTAEAYSPIRRALTIGFPMILMVTLIGAGLMVWHLNPLVARMRRSERAAADAAVKTHAIMEAAGEGIVTIDPRGVIQSANGAAHQIFGYENAKLLGRNVVDLVPEQARDAHLQGLTRLAEGAAPDLLDTPNIQVRGMKADGSQFPLEFTISAASVAGQPLFVGVMRDITARRETEEKMSRLAQYDSLTGLPNRALFMDRLGTALHRAKRSQRILALMFVDLDGFKEINDTFGHREGDGVLVEAATRLSSAVRKSDTVARLAGDEFTIILENLGNSEADAQAITAKVVEVMRAPFIVAGQAANITASIGLVVHAPHRDDADVAELLSRADDAMYEAKRSGKNAYRMFAAA